MISLLKKKSGESMCKKEKTTGDLSVPILFLDLRFGAELVCEGFLIFFPMVFLCNSANFGGKNGNHVISASLQLFNLH
jgi:hypothetical protein